MTEIGEKVRDVNSLHYVNSNFTLCILSNLLHIVLFQKVWLSL